MAVSMKAVLMLVLLAGPVAATNADGPSFADLNPIGRVLDMLADLQAKVEAEGEAEEKAFKEFFEWCDDAAREAKNSMKTATKEKEKSEATIAKSSADIEAA